MKRIKKMTAEEFNDKVRITARIPQFLIDKIDALTEKAFPPISKNTWIIQAIINELKRVEN